MPYRPRYDKGDWKAICDSCGRELKASELRKRWDGFMVCAGDWEPRQPQDFVRGVADFQAPPFTRSEPADVFVPFNYAISLSDSFPVSETIAKTFYKNISPTVSDNAVNTFALNISGLNSVSVSNDFSEESISFSETIVAGKSKAFTDSVSISETFVKSIKPVTSDSFNIDETISVSLLKSVSLTDSFSISESTSLKPTKVLSDSVSLSESTTLYIDSPTMVNGAGINLYSIG